MSGPPINFTSIDFDTIKADLIEYITDHPESGFTDHNTDGSNLDYIMNMLSIVTNLLAYNLNQGINETYLSTATIRANILKIIKLLNYTPARATSASIIVDLSAITWNGAGTQFLLKYDKIVSGNYNFYYTGDQLEVSGIAQNDITFYEGTLVEIVNQFTGDGTTFQSYTIEDTNIGNYLVAFTRNEVTGVRTYWTEFVEGTYYEDAANEYIYFIEEVENGYKLSFGNDALGRSPSIGEKIDFEYIQPSGSVGNELSTFTWDGGGPDETINTGYADQNIDDCTVTLDSSNTQSSGAKVKETISEIKFNAPKFSSSQGRCVTEDDYEALAVKHALVSKAVAVGGEKVTPIQLGKVFITCKPTTGETFSTAQLTALDTYFLNYSVVTIDPTTENPQYIYLKFTTTLRYTSTQAPDTTATATAIQTFINTSNAEFGEYLEASKLLSTIDDSDSLTTSNITIIEKYALLTEDNFTNDTEDGSYDITLTKNLKSSYATKIEKVDADGTVIQTWNEDTDYTVTYNTAANGGVEIEFDSGDDLEISDTGNGDSEWHLFFDTSDADIFLNSAITTGQLFLSRSADIAISTEKITV